jgi:transposase
MAKIKEQKREDVLKYIREGMSDKDACLLAGISQETFYAWINGRKDKTGKVIVKVDSAFSESLKAARAEFKRLHIKNITRVAVKGGQWTASAFLLERKFPDEFGQKAKVDVESESLSKLFEAAFGKKLNDTKPHDERANGGTV